MTIKDKDLFIKRKQLEAEMRHFIKTSLDITESENKLDHFTIEITNHNGSLQMDHQIRERIKAY